MQRRKESTSTGVRKFLKKFFLEFLNNYPKPIEYTHDFLYKIQKALYPEKYKNFEDFCKTHESTPYIKNLDIPTLMISSRNDCTLREDLIPWEEIEKNKNVFYVYTHKGGHLEFFTGLNRERWYKRIMSKFLNCVEEFETRGV